MVIDLIVEMSDDGVTADVPSLKGCDTWAHTEDEAIEKVLELVRFYADISEDIEILVDRARKQKNKIVYKLVFDKNK